MADVSFVVEAADEATLVRCVRIVRAHDGLGVEVTSPYPFEHPELPGAHPQERAVALAGLVCGLSGGLLAYALQWWINVVDYPLDVGARPLHSAPAFIPLTFETTVLLAGVSIFFAFFVASKLPRLAHPSFAVPGIERATADRLFIHARIEDTRFADLRDEALAAGALRVEAW